MKHDKVLLKQRFERHLGTYDTLATVQRAIAGRLATLLESTGTSDLKEGGKKGVEIGTGTGFLTRHLIRLFPRTEWTLNDLVPKSRDFLPPTTPCGVPLRFTAGDGELFRFGTAVYDLIASASTVQWFDDLPGFIARAAAGLAPGGILALGTFGPENFREITATTGQGLEYYPLGELVRIFSTNGLRILSEEEWIEEQHYPAPTDVLRHLRLTGVNAVAAERWTHSRLKQFEADYRSAYSVGAASASGPKKEEEKSGESVTLTFHPILLIAEKH
ncbi:methyltransferase domain-containing protein [uncultured Rikenella sp.]|uniref:methyltransferase domain-containing protein n=1 Tax=uncultured Rikenella sp. TaxID=368003 RepID=UPI002605C8EE|nr:methyltransferase domain-containing protein [uncultured Rikenella sp.]